MSNKLNFSGVINWWGRGLGYLCPASVRNVFITTPELITIEFKEQEVLLKRYTAKSDEAFEHHQFNTKDDIERARTISWLLERIEDDDVLGIKIPTKSDGRLFKDCSEPFKTGIKNAALHYLKDKSGITTQAS